MEPSSLKPTAPIPTGRRARSRTLEYYPRHRPETPSQLAINGPRMYPWHSHADVVAQSPEIARSIPEKDRNQSDTPKPALEIVDSMRLQVIRDKDGKTLGLRVVDFNSTKNKDANISALLPLATTNTGLVFSVDTPEGIQAAYNRAKDITGSKRIMGIMFAPPNEPESLSRDVDWSVLFPSVEDKSDKLGPEKVGAKIGLDIDMEKLDLKGVEEGDKCPEENDGKPETESFIPKVAQWLKGVNPDSKD
ncbi:hypothetical protein NW762_006305 [Fusarium torreyae]|uniref:Uncharacterized protein n=1 Tax=Fusarium torreyae TaxID=1237075 RepID=A0A9W8S1S0_9HYPO|nr:hypothetical protein NW762_006305 [Fusarium torreyae]